LEEIRFEKSRTSIDFMSNCTLYILVKTSVDWTIRVCVSLFTHEMEAHTSNKD